jgi:RimJ/RimL family protein N-acetyltransferase
MTHKIMILLVRGGVSTEQVLTLFHSSETIPMPAAASFQAFLSGPRLDLREVRPDDVTNGYYQWMNDPEVMHYLESRFFPNSVEGLRTYIAERHADRTNVFLALVVRDGARHIGNIKLGPIDWIHRRADIGILIGEKDCWGAGFATEAIRLIVEYAFRRLNLHKVTAGCYDDNGASVRAFEKVGFIREGLRKEHFYCDGRYTDLILLGLIRQTEFVSDRTETGR